MLQCKDPHRTTLDVECPAVELSKPELSLSSFPRHSQGPSLLRQMLGNLRLEKSYS